MEEGRSGTGRLGVVYDRRRRQATDDGDGTYNIAAAVDDDCIAGSDGWSASIGSARALPAADSATASVAHCIYWLDGMGVTVCCVVVHSV